MTPLLTLLKREAALVAGFRDTLLLEQEILRSGNAEELAEINTKKLALVESLNSAGVERSQILSAGKTATVDMQAWFSAHPLETESAALWADLLETARDAREINALNGNLINTLHQKTSDALSILTRSEAEQSLYSRSGQSSPNTGSRIIDSA